MFNLDTHSLILIVFLGHLLSLIVYLLYVFLYRIKDSNLTLYIVAKTIQSITFFVFSIWSDKITNYAISMATALVFTGASIEIYCMLSINKGTNIKRLKITLLFLTLLSIILFTTLNRNIITRAVVVSTFLSVIFSYLFIELSVKKGNSKMQNITGWIALTFVLVNIIRGTYIMFTRIELPINSTVHVQIMLSLISVIVAFAFPLLFLFILKEKDNNKLQELNNTKDKLFSIIGHDLKGPIAQMIQFAHLIEDSSIDLSKEELLMYIKKLKESSIQGYKLLENLLEWGCSQTGSISFTPTSFSINESIIENIELLSKQAETKNIKMFFLKTDIHFIIHTGGRSHSQFHFI